MPKKRTFTQEDTDKIIKLYCEEKLSIRYIAKQVFHCRESSISKILKDNQITFRGKTLGRKLNSREEQMAIDLYVKGKLNQRQLAEKFNCCTDVIHKILIRNNIEIKTQPRINKKIKEDYFKEIDSEKKAYFLGFIFADGSIYKNQLSIEIHSKDRYILDLFKEELQLDSKISYRKKSNTETCRILLSSNKICKDLEQYGIVPNKTYLTKHLPEIPLKFLRHFLRGLVDGDGWISIDKSHQYHIGFVSYSQSVCEDFQKYCNSLIEKKSNSRITPKNKESSCYQCQFQGNIITKQLATALYKDNAICLSRKYRLVEPLFDFKNDEDIV